MLFAQPVLGYEGVLEPNLSPIAPPSPDASLACYATQAGFTLRDLAIFNGVVNPYALGNVSDVSVLNRDGVMTSVPLLLGETPLTIAVRRGISIWDMRKLNPNLLFTGGYVAVDGEPSACMPYPLLESSLAASNSLSVKQGQVALVSMRTAEPSLCEIAYLDTVSPCYPGEGNALYAFIAISALAAPGSYPLALTLKTPTVTTEYLYELQVAPAYYGFQYIDPPPELSSLLDAQFMQEELDYLAKWRAIRTGEQAWSLPLQYPLALQTSISADYGASRSYGGMVDGYHSGIDYRAWRGVEVVAPADGTVLMSEYLSARGNAILIDHGWGLVTGYWHLSESRVTVGQQIKRGEVIALVGNTGLSTGAHLHWEVWMNGVSVDGKQWLDDDLSGACSKDVCTSRVTVTIPTEVE